MGELLVSTPSRLEARPPLPDFATQPIQEALDFNEIVDSLRQRELIQFDQQKFGFAFRSERLPGSNTKALNKLDDRVQAEARTAEGFIDYIKGKSRPDGTCVSICFWDSPEAAKAALKLPAHTEAVQRIEEFYQWCTLDHMLLTDTPDGPQITAIGDPRNLDFRI